VDKVHIASDHIPLRPTYDESGDRAAALESADVR
jgi:hypothetical protein